MKRRTFNQGITSLGLAGLLSGVAGPSMAAKMLIYGNAGNIDSASNKFAKKWLDLVNKRTNGALAFDIKAGTIGGGKDVLDGTALGTVHIYNGAYTGLREFDIFYAPYFGLLYLSVARAGPWKLFTKEKLESFDDLKGMKIRAPSIEGVIAGLEQVGAKPTVIPFNELYGALQQGVVDGMATLGNLMISQKFYEVTKYCYQNDWGIGLDKQMMNVGAWNSLSKEQQSILVDTFNELEPQDFFRATEDAEKTNFAKWRELNGADTTPMLDASAAQRTLEPAIKKLADDIFGAGTYDKIQSI